MFGSAADKWNTLHWAGKVVLSFMAVLVAVAGGVKAWNELDLPVPATQAWVLAGQSSLSQGIQSIQVGQMQNRISTIKDLLIQIEIQKSKAGTKAEQLKLDFQATELKNEWAGLEKKIQSIQTMQGGGRN